ncbi:MAG: potassium channel family protein [Peptococcaceae bacterium]|nr:potassium channel family protein [Peptococcaceae bacterium]
MGDNERFYAYALKKAIIVALSTPVIYAFLYRLLVCTDPRSFYGISSEDGFIDFLYFSVTSFTTTGYGDIYPLTIVGKLLVFSEITAGIVLIGLIIYCNTKRIYARKKICKYSVNPARVRRCP